MKGKESLFHNLYDEKKLYERKGKERNIEGIVCLLLHMSCIKQGIFKKGIMGEKCSLIDCIPVPQFHLPSASLSCVAQNSAFFNNKEKNLKVI